MDITYYSARYSNSAGVQLHGSVFSSKNMPCRMQAVLCPENGDRTLGLGMWKAYRSRRDGEGQRQLSKAMDMAAYSVGFSKTGEYYTEYSFRPPSA